MAEPAWLSPSEAARLLHISSQRVRELADQGRLRAQRTALGRLIDRGDVERLAAERAERSRP